MSVTELAAGESPLLDLDPDRPWVVSCWGRKGSGKSVLNRELFRSYPYDRVCIDVNGNADPGEGTEDLTLPLPVRFPEAPALPGEPRRARSLRFRAHPHDRAYREHLDQAVALALFPQRRRTCLWAGEVGELQPHGRPTPHMRLALMQNRHHNTTLLFDGPRPMFVDPLTLAQSDIVAVFELPNPRDRDRIADNIGIAPALFSKTCREAWRTEHGFVLFDSRRRNKLFVHEPLPIADERPSTAAA